ncbi:hypothetical protein IWX49DRAFT_557565 [Phyllosticta citricarpa]
MEAQSIVREAAEMALSRLEAIIQLKTKEIVRLTEELIERNHEFYALQQEMAASKHRERECRDAKEKAEQEVADHNQLLDMSENRERDCKVVIQILVDAIPRDTLEKLPRDLVERLKDLGITHHTEPAEV